MELTAHPGRIAEFRRRGLIQASACRPASGLAAFTPRGTPQTPIPRASLQGYDPEASTMGREIAEEATMAAVDR